MRTRENFLGLLAALVAPAFAQEPSPQPPTPRPSERVSPSPRVSLEPTVEELRAAVDDGLAFLAREQNADGSFRIEATLPPSVRGPSETVQRAPVAVTALAALAFLAHGVNPRHGPHSDALRRAVEYLISRSRDASSPEAGYIVDLDDTLSRMHGHGFATLALSEACGQFHKNAAESTRLRTALTAAVQRIQLAQSATGGWWYDPVAGPAHENSITICAVQALRSARDAGFAVELAGIERAIEYVKRCRKADGSYKYSWDDEKSSVALTAAAVATLIELGLHDGDELEQALEWIDAQPGLPGFPERAQRTTYFPEYERLYVALAYYRSPDLGRWKRWFPRAAARLLAEQEDQGEAKGAWPRRGSGDPSVYGRCYETASNCLVLSIPSGYLPCFKR
ncbi:MAG: hypothetical protein JNM84_19550 [Planctomycetes bacterium]|nr:hypothetical protein [Planctomycetota bacterium]